MKERFCLAAVALLAGCSTTHVPIVPPSLTCTPPEQMQQTCAAPQRLKDGLSYAELITAYQTDRQALQRCALQHESLKQAVASCQDAITRHNAELAKIGEEAQKQVRKP
ncbi:MAG: hypothetical protein RLY71_3750 [Pseudomonadota bacterium]|jgi:uncharacterized lipoprotein YajG